MTNSSRRIWRRRLHFHWKRWHSRNFIATNPWRMAQPQALPWNFQHVSTDLYHCLEPEHVTKLTIKLLSMISAQSNLSSVSVKSNQLNQLMTRPRPGSFGNSPSTSFNSGKSFPTSSSSGSLAPPPITQRNPNRTQSKPNETDLISFANPTEIVPNDDSLLLATDSALATTASSPANDSHSNFKQMVDEIHRYLPILFA